MVRKVSTPLFISRSRETRPESRWPARLVEARRRRGLSRAMAARALRVPEAQIQALEEGNLSFFSAEVYARGLFMKYARMLDLPQAYRQEFLRILTGAREVVPLHIHSPLPWVQGITARWVLVLLFCVAGFFVSGFLGWQVYGYWRLPDLVVTEPVSDIVDGSVVVVRGMAETGNVVRLNEQLIVLAEDGTFAVPLYLEPGVSVLRVESENAAGRVRVVERSLLVPRP